MLRILARSLLNLRVYNKPLFFSSNIMEPEKDIITIDYTKDQFGDYPFIKSTFRSDRKWIQIKKVDETLDGQEVLVRGRIHTIRGKKNNSFVVLRQSFATLQAVAFKGQTISPEMIKYMNSVPCQSIVDIFGKVKKPEKPINTCTQQVQLQIQKFFVVNRAIPRLPLQILDASRKVTHNQFDPNQGNEQTKPEEKQPEGKQGKQGQTKQAIVSMKTRLDNRVIDLRTQAKQAIFRISSGVCQIYRQFLLQREFVEIHTPKLIAGSSQGGANVFNLSYFNRKACLAQSPQLYKQMCVMGDFQKVFEIGPVFRAENSLTHRHMCQFVGLDIQMSIKQHYFQILEFFSDLFSYLFENLAKRYERQIKVVNEQFECEPFVNKNPAVRITFEEGIKLLKENGVQWSVNEDLDTITEKKLGQIIRAKYQTDFYMMHRYPVSARPFYTTLCEDDPKFTCSYDFFMRGQQILSGAQRIHDPIVLQERAKACGIDPSTIQDYINCFKYGAYPHGGGGIGLERVVMLFMGLKNIRNASLFPRDPKRITP